MSYGDGGFYFLQPVDNGYGALASGKKFGRYQMLYQPEGAYSSKERAADIKKMRALVKKLRGDKKRAASALSGIIRTEGTAKNRTTKGRAAWLLRRAGALKRRDNIAKSITRMERNVNLAKGRSAAPGGIMVKTPSTTPREWQPTPITPEFVPLVPSGFAPAAPEEMLAAGEEVIVTPDGTLARVAVVTPDEISVAEGISMPEFPVSFYERYRTFILLGGAGVGAWALWKIMR